MKKILILVLGTHHPEYRPLYESQKKTWASIKFSEINIFYYYGDNGEIEGDNKLENNDLFLKIPDGYSHVAEKTIRALNFFKDYEYDYIVRTNAGSYINQKNLIKFLNDKPNENFYTGIIGEIQDIKFASGSCFILSKDLCQKIVNNIDNELFGKYFDDVVISQCLKKINVEVDKCGFRISNGNGKITYDINEGYPFFDISDENNYHYRFRSDGDRNIDIKNMYELHEKLIIKNLI